MTTTFLFTDTAGITDHWADDPTGLGPALAAHDEAAGRAIALAGGRVFRRSGQGLGARFADGAAAVRAALALADDPDGDGLARVGLDTGRAVAHGDDWIGPAPTRAARIAAVAADGQVLASHDLVAALDDVGHLRVVDLGSRLLPGLGPHDLHALATLSGALDADATPGTAGGAVPAALHRDGERAAVHAMLQASRAGPAGLVLAGEAGIGKTVVWRDGLAAARLQGFEVLAAVAPEPDAVVAYGVLRDLAAGFDDRAVAALPDPQRDALDVVLLRRRAPGRSIAWETVAAAVRTLLADRAGHRPVLVAIDDVGWVDQDSARVLAHALQRCARAPVGLLATERTGPGERSATWLHGLGPMSLDRMELGRMAPERLASVLEQRIGGEHNPGVLRRIARRADGHPLLAFELARAGEGAAGARPGTNGSATAERVRDLVTRRLAALPDDAVTMLATLAVATTDRIEVVRRALPDDVDVVAATAAARQAGLVDAAGARLAFAHPLYRHAVRDTIPVPARLALHAALARVADDPVMRADHLGRATIVPDERVATVLANAAEMALERGAPTEAASLATRAMDLTPAADLHRRIARGLLAAGAHTAVGDVEPAERLLERLADLPAEPSDRCRVALARVRWFASDMATALAELDDLATLDGLDDDVLVQLHHVRSTFILISGDLRGAVVAGQRALDAAAQAGPVVRARAMGVAGQSQDLRGLPRGRTLLAEAVRLVDEHGGPPTDPLSLTEGPHVALALSLAYADDLDGARDLMARRIDLAHAIGQDASAVLLHLHAVEIEARAGLLDAADRHLAAILELEHPHEVAANPGLAYAFGLVAALRGDDERAAAHARDGLRAARDGDQVLWQLGNQWVLGHLALARGDATTADRHLAPLVELEEHIGMVPQVHRVSHDVTEAAVLVGDLARAERILTHLEQHAARSAGHWVAAGIARNRALLALARDDDDVAERVEVALAEAELVPDPHERARTRLVAGIGHRRLGARAVARDHLDAAVATFERHGMAQWAARARTERDRISGRRPTEGSALTGTEARVAELAAAGHTNGEIASRLFLSPKTVEHNLTRVYRKLGIRSRTELAARGTLDDM